MLHKVFKIKLSSKQSAKMICRFDRLRTAHSKNKQAIQIIEHLSATHTFDYIVLRVNPGLTSCEHLVKALGVTYLLK